MDVSRRSSFQRSNSRLVGAFERTIQKGFYELEVTGGQTEVLQQGLHRFAVNVSPDESNFLRLTKPQLETMLPSAKLTTVDASAEAQQLYGSIGDEREIWRPLIILTFIVIGIEFLLATLGGHSLDNSDSADDKPAIARSRSWKNGGTNDGLGVPRTY